MFSYNFIYIYTLCNYIYTTIIIIVIYNLIIIFYCTQIPEINLLKLGTILDHFIKPDLIKYLFLYDISVFILIKCVYFYILNIHIRIRIRTTVKYMLN